MKLGWIRVGGALTMTLIAGIQISNLRSPTDRTLAEVRVPTGGGGHDRRPCDRGRTDRDGVVFSRTTGRSGDTVRVRVVRPLYHEDGSYDPSGSIQIWWNVRPDTWPFLTPGSSVPPSPAISGTPTAMLSEIGPGTSCFGRARFRVPDDPPGSYPLLVVGVTGNSATVMDRRPFRVVP